MTTTETWTIGRLLAWTTEYLKKAGSHSPRLDAEVLLAHARGCQRIELYTAFSEEPSEQTRAAFRNLVRRRAEGAPVAYLVGYKEFFSMTFEVNSNVLVPRPETEHLVLEALDRAKLLLKELTSQDNSSGSWPNHDPSNEQTSKQSADSIRLESPPEGDPDSLRDNLASSSAAGSPPASTLPRLHLADIGTGSGAVAIAILKHLPQSRMTAVDLCPSALEVAKRNAQRYAMDQDRISFVEGDLLSWCAHDQQFDMIVSNPPYVSPEEYENLPKTVRDYEPRSALISEPDGGSVIARLIAQARQHIRLGGYLIFEFSPMLETCLGELISPKEAWGEPEIARDISGSSRVVILKRIEGALP